MTTTIPDNTTARPVIAQYNPEADMTPTDCLEDGRNWASESIIRWMQQPENEHYLIDMMFERNANSMRDQAIKAWDKAVRSGEWA